MLDGHTYRISQSLARRELPSWRLAAFHKLIPYFGSLPHDTLSLSELWEILDTMQEGRFEEYMKATNGLSVEDADLLVDALTDLVIFQKIYMPQAPARLPFSTMISALALYNKLRDYSPGFKTVLEIGPGCGYVSLFLKRYAALENYTQTEVCEPFYLLQNAINNYAFPTLFKEHAFPASSDIKPFTLDLDFMEPISIIDDPVMPKCAHYPWWKLGGIANGATKFDVVTTNATMMEMEKQALWDYLGVARLTMKSDGLLIAQCLGGEINTKRDELREVLYQSGFAPLIYVETPGTKTMFDSDAMRDIDVYFPVTFGIFVRKGHPCFERYYHRANYAREFIAPERFVWEPLYRPYKEPRTVYSRTQLTEMVRERLAARVAAQELGS